MPRRKKQEITDSEVIRSLPHNRKEVFFDFIKHRKMDLFVLSCFTFMFFIPLAVNLFYFNFLEAVAMENEKNDYLFSLIFYSMLIMLPCMIMGFLGFGGAFHVVKKMVWQEGTMIAVDFFKGLKENWLHSLIDGIIFGLFLFGFVVGGCYLFIYAPIDAIWKGVGIGALILLLLVFGMVISLNQTQSVYYTNSYFITLKNSFSFLGLLNWRILLLFLFSTGAVIALCCFNTITMAIGLFLFAIFNSVVITLYTLISHYGFDKYINQEHYPEYVGKGLYKEIKKEENIPQEDKKEA